MVTDSAHHHSQPTTPGLLARAGGQVRQFICGLHGHDSLLHFEEGRLSLLCTSCGHETPGWDVKSAPVQHQAVEQKSRRVMRMPLVSQRRIA
jgi:hypothetical protein